MNRNTDRLFKATLLVILATPALAADVTVTLDAGAGFVVEDNTSTIERLRIDEATGNISRNGALFVHTTGTFNTFVGESAGNTGTTGIGANSAFGKNALSSNTTGFQNSAFGSYALLFNTEGTENSAFGEGALLANTTGDRNSAFGVRALDENTTGDGNSAFGRHSLSLNTTGCCNSAFGEDALQFSTGSRNAAFGYRALRNNKSSYNAAVGYKALYSNNTGFRNVAVGYNALGDNTSGTYNVGLGNGAGNNLNVGARNVAIGSLALGNATSGNDNIAIGLNAGSAQTTGSRNIYIGSNSGVAGESGQIKIGSLALHDKVTIAGIHGTSASGGITVFVNASGVLGTGASSLRFKQGVRDMGETSEVLLQLRPVTFRYRKEVAGGGEDVPQYGLIAEEVAEVAPELVARDAKGQPYSVRYHVLPSLLLNEMQKQQRTIETLLARVEQLEQGPGTEPTETDR